MLFFDVFYHVLIINLYFYIEKEVFYGKRYDKQTEDCACQKNIKVISGWQSEKIVLLFLNG